MSKDLLKRGFKFVGSKIYYAFMQAVGMVNDHTTNCFRYKITILSCLQKYHFYGILSLVRISGR